MKKRNVDQEILEGLKEIKAWQKGKKKLKVGIMPLDEFKQRTIAIAKGKLKPKKGEPKIWFSSKKSLTTALEEKNKNFLKLLTS